MKVCIPFAGRTIGGPSTFAQKLGQGLTARGVGVVDACSEDCDVLLAIVSAPLRELLKAKRWGIPIVQRLDGVYYPAVSGWRWWIYDVPIWLTYRFFADWVVFQSEYSLRMCVHFLGTPRSPSSTVYNGVDLEVFSPDGGSKRLAEGPVLLCLLATFWRRSEILPVLDAFDRMRARHADAHLAVVGKFMPSVSFVRESRPDVHWLGQVPHRDLPALYRGAELMLSSKLRSPCPNAVIEAMASGLPIACYDSGGHRELVGDEGGVCVPLEDSFGPFPALDSGDLVEAGNRVLESRSEFARGARRRAEQRFGLDQMVDGYIEAFEEAIRTRGR